jgi:hypothetical protein
VDRARHLERSLRPGFRSPHRPKVRATGKRPTSCSAPARGLGSAARRRRSPGYAPGMGKVLAAVGCLVGASVVVRLLHDRRERGLSPRRSIAPPEKPPALGPSSEPASVDPGLIGRQGPGPSVQAPEWADAGSGISGDGHGAFAEPSPDVVSGEPEAGGDYGDAAPAPSSDRTCFQDLEPVESLAGLPRRSLFEMAKERDIPAARRLTMTREELIDAILTAGS